jgi:AcrR family transcriptional regulator
MSRDRDFKDRLEDFAGRQIEKAFAKPTSRVRSIERRLAREAEAELKKGAKLSREQIAAAALAIADAQGFEAVSMRKIAAVLGSGTMSLYHYVHTKDDLVGLMDDAIMGEVLMPDGKLPPHWRTAITAIAHRTRDAFLRHPWALTAQMRSPPRGANAMKHVDQSLAALKNTDLETNEKFTVLTLVDDYVFGHTIRANAEIGVDADFDSPEAKAFFEAMTAELAAGHYPELSAALGPDLQAAVKRFGDGARVSRFELGLEIILDGAAAKFNLPD